MYRTVFWTLWEKARVGCIKKTASKHVYYLGWNRSPAQVGCMRQALRPGALGRPRGIGWRGRWEGGSGCGTLVNPWLIHFNVWQNPLQLKKKKKRKWLEVLDQIPRNVHQLTQHLHKRFISISGSPPGPKGPGSCLEHKIQDPGCFLASDTVSGLLWAVSVRCEQSWLNPSAKWSSDPGGTQSPALRKTWYSHKHFMWVFTSVI